LTVVEPDDTADPRHFAAVRKPLLQADTLPAWCYQSAGFYRREVRQVFAKSWNFIGHADQLPQPGSYLTGTLAGVPFLVVRGKDLQLRAFANTCRHRGALLLQGQGETAAIRCPYHSWTYDLTGRLRGAAGMEHTEAFDPAQFGLTRFRLEIWENFLFLCMDEAAPPLAQWLGDLPERLAPYALGSMTLVRLKSWDIDCNWKIYVENAMESYHVPTVHMKTIALQKRDINPPLFGTGQWCGLFTRHTGSRALEAGDTGFPYISGLTGDSAEGSHYILLYPTTMLALTFDCMWWLEVYPLGPEKMTVRSGALFPKSTCAREDFPDIVEKYYRRWDRSIVEDNEISALQQRGLTSPFALPGRYSHLEPLVHSLALWVLDRVAPQNNGGA
jgi:phenylpropionate dioxygenase-like ring-hydroxylating dioxygenase large terminal subunit